MITKHTFLVELGTEELPPTQLLPIITDFTNGLTKALHEANLEYDKINDFIATPRRIAVLVEGLRSQAAPKVIEKFGPAKAACYDAEGNLTKAAQGWLKANNISFEQAKFVATDKGERLYFVSEQEGQKATDILFELVKKAVDTIQISKGMRWGDHQFTFIRPVHTFTMMLDDQIIPGELFGVKSDNLIYGHRFLGSQSFRLDHAQNYLSALREQGHVVPEFFARRNQIEAQIKAIVAQKQGFVDLEEDLLLEVTSLVEFPNVLCGNFDPEFLVVPKEALIHTMKGDQRYFPVFADAQFSELLPFFIFVSNINPKDPSLIIAGNEKVIRPRLTDAKFFYEQDLKHPLEANLPRLKQAVFQHQLGSIYDKVERLQKIASYLANKFNFDQALAQRAALLAKCDLMTNMVFEFTSTQGIMGMYYANANGENPAVAQALFEQYLPRFSGDKLPESEPGIALSLADKLDTLIGIFGINQPPKGAKDPFALRRASIGIARILIENKLDLDLAQAIEFVIDVYGDKLTVAKPQLLSDILSFVYARLRPMYEEQGYTPGQIQAVQAQEVTNLADFDLRIQAVREFSSNAALEDLVAANKRVKNFLEKSTDSATQQINPELFELEEEKALYASLTSLETKCFELYQAHKYFEILSELASMREVINNFFDKVIINSEDQAVKANRYAILRKINQLFTLVADISLLN